MTPFSLSHSPSGGGGVSLPRSAPGRFRGVLGRMTFGGQATSSAESGHVWALQYRVLRSFFCTVAVGTWSRVLWPNTMKVGHQRVASSALCYGDTLMSGPVILPASVTQIAAREGAMNSRVHRLELDAPSRIYDSSSSVLWCCLHLHPAVLKTCCSLFFLKVSFPHVLHMPSASTALCYFISFYY